MYTSIDLIVYPCLFRAGVEHESYALAVADREAVNAPIVHAFVVWPVHRAIVESGKGLIPKRRGTVVGAGAGQTGLEQIAFGGREEALRTGAGPFDDHLRRHRPKETFGAMR